MMTYSQFQVTIIEPGWFHRESADVDRWCLQHPAYTGEHLAGTRARKGTWGNDFTRYKDPRKGVEVFYKAASLPDPPLHFLVGKDAIEGVRKKMTDLAATIDQYESWSDGL